MAGDTTIDEKVGQQTEVQPTPSEMTDEALAGENGYVHILNKLKLTEDQGWFWDDEDLPSGREGDLTPEDAKTLSPDFQFLNNRAMNVLISAEHGDLLGDKYMGGSIKSQAKFWTSVAKSMGNEDIAQAWEELSNTTPELEQDNDLTEERVVSNNFGGQSEYLTTEKMQAIGSFLTFVDQNSAQINAFFKEATEKGFTAYGGMFGAYSIQKPEGGHDYAKASVEGNIKRFGDLVDNLRNMAFINQTAIPYRQMEINKDDLARQVSTNKNLFPFLKNEEEQLSDLQNPAFTVALLQTPTDQANRFKVNAGTPYELGIPALAASMLKPDGVSFRDEFTKFFFDQVENNIDPLKELVKKHKNQIPFMKKYEDHLDDEGHLVLYAALFHLPDAAKAEFKDLTGIEHDWAAAGMEAHLTGEQCLDIEKIIDGTYAFPQDEPEITEENNPGGGGYTGTFNNSAQNTAQTSDDLYVVDMLFEDMEVYKATNSSNGSVDGALLGHPGVRINRAGICAIATERLEKRAKELGIEPKEISKAIMEGRFNPDPRDLDLAYYGLSDTTVYTDTNWTQLSAAWNERFGALSDPNFSVNTIIGGKEVTMSGHDIAMRRLQWDTSSGRLEHEYGISKDSTLSYEETLTSLADKPQQQEEFKKAVEHKMKTTSVASFYLKGQSDYEKLREERYLPKLREHADEKRKAFQDAKNDTLGQDNQDNTVSKDETLDNKVETPTINNN